MEKHKSHFIECYKSRMEEEACAGGRGSPDGFKPQTICPQQTRLPEFPLNVELDPNDLLCDSSVGETVMCESRDRNLRHPLR